MEGFRRKSSPPSLRTRLRDLRRQLPAGVRPEHFDSSNKSVTTTCVSGRQVTGAAAQTLVGAGQVGISPPL
jgi:hypothetical protein